MTKQEVIKILSLIKSTVFLGNRKFLDALDRAIELLKQPEQQWIPVSGGLPKAQTEVIVSCTDDSGDTKFRYTSSGWVTTDKEYWIVDNEINDFVVAWKEMPEPYKGEQV